MNCIDCIHYPNCPEYSNEDGNTCNDFCPESIDRIDVVRKKDFDEKN